ncbi:MAG: hypothetical protein HQL09_10105 [Nitrospirae bacterium]|nr:hypothetical protein [Nitrospirota bacterium]
MPGANEVFDGYCILLKQQSRAGGAASSLYLSPGNSPFIRVRNKFIESDNIPPIGEKEISDIVDYLFDCLHIKAEKPLMEIGLNYEAKGVGSFKAAITLGQKGYTIMISPLSREIPDLDSLGLPESIKQFVYMQRGLVIVIGKRSSGKSTTTASIISFINRNFTKKITVIEESPNYYHDDWLSIVNQPYIRYPDLFKSVESIERTIGDASVLAIDGLPMYETMKIALHAVNKGMFVIASVNANGGVPEVLRLIVESFPENERKEARFSLSSALECAFWQELLPNTRGDGLVPVFEILLNDPVIAGIIRNDAFHLLRPTIAAGAVRGMRTINQALNEMTASGAIAEDTASSFREVTYSRYIHPIKEAYL